MTKQQLPTFGRQPRLVHPRRYSRGLEHDGDPFAPPKPTRELVVMIDSDLLDQLPPGAVPSPIQVLSDLLVDNELIELFRYSDEGVPGGLVAIAEAPGEDQGIPVYEGWVELKGWDLDSGRGSVTYAVNGSWAMAALNLRSVHFALNDSSSRCYESLDPEEASERRKQDQLAAEVAAQGVQADLFVTRRCYLVSDSGSKLNTELTIMEPEDALQLVGLFLRDKGRFLPVRGVSFSTSLFYWVATRELLPSGWRWFGAVVAHDTDSEDASLTYLAQSAFQRVARAIETRDRILVAMNRGPRREHDEAALSSLEAMLLFLMGAVDVTARVVHRSLQLSSSERTAGWQNEGWLRDVEAVAPAVSTLLTSSQHRQATLTILRLLRNSIHGEALRGITHQSRGDVRTLIGFPSQDEAQLLEAMEACGGHEAWEVEQVGPLGMFTDPGVLADNVFRLAIQLLDDIMQVTPVELLPGVDMAAVAPEAPRSKPGEFLTSFSPRYAKPIRYQLGL